MDTLEFLRFTITASQGGWLNISASLPNGEGWRQYWRAWPDDEQSAVELIQGLKDEGLNVYYSCHLFREKDTHKQHVMDTRTIFCDLDLAEPPLLPIHPSMLVKSSDERHQAYWLLNEWMPAENIEEISRRVTYGTYKADHSGWSLGHMMRVPNTLNWKYVPQQKVRVVSHNKRVYDSVDFGVFPTLASSEPNAILVDEKWIEQALAVPVGYNNVHTFWDDQKGKLTKGTEIHFYTEAPDRSRSLWRLMTECFRAGMPREHVYLLAYHSKNNKFAYLRYGGARELAKDVLRAEREVFNGPSGIRSRVNDTRRGSGPLNERRQAIADMCRNQMLTHGRFVHARGGSMWYILEQEGRPVPVARSSTTLNVLLDAMFALNSTEPEHQYVVAHLINYVAGMQQTGEIASLSHYIQDTETLLLHTGTKDILRITGDTIDTVTNGYKDIIFLWNSDHTIRPNIDTSTPTPTDTTDAPAPTTWYDQLFGVSLANLTADGVTQEQALALLRSWFMCLLMREALQSRPILAIFGQPGCIAGSTQLDIRRGEHSARTYTLADLYRKTHHKWDMSIPIRVRSTKDGIVAWRSVRQFIASGTKDTYTVKVQGRESFRVTADHRFLTPEGYKPLSELSAGRDVIVEGAHLTGNGRAAKWRREVSVQYHPYGREKIVNGCGPYRYIYHYRAVVEARMNGMYTDEFVHIVHNDAIRAATLVYLPAKAVIHHKDENPFNDAWENLEVHTKDSHDTYHGYRNVRNFGVWSGLNDIDIALIESIEPYGKEMTYDVEMEDASAPNFLINGVAVHNSGKSTLFKRVYALLYGPHKAVSGVGTAQEFDYAMSVDPLLVLDNVDTWEKWLPDRIARAAGVSEITRRKLYTDVDTITLRLQAFLGITAHNPKFGREDVLDRFVMITLERIQHFGDETAIINGILNARDTYWGQIARDIQCILREPTPPDSAVAQFRVQDFSKFGQRIANALGFGDTFRAGITSMVDQQKGFVLDEDSILVDLIATYIKNPRCKNEEFVTPARLWGLFDILAGPDKAFAKQYGNSTKLGRKLWAMQDALKQRFVVEWKFDTTQKQKVWRFMSKDGVG